MPETTAQGQYTSFKLHIDFGNESMQTLEDVAACLRDAAEQIQAGTSSSKILDANGNTVGNWTAR